jgi:hypothetical protein
MSNSNDHDYSKNRKAKQNFFAVALLLLWLVIWCAVKLKWINGI